MWYFFVVKISNDVDEIVRYVCDYDNYRKN